MRNKQFKKYMTYFGVAMVAYAIAIFIYVGLLNAYRESSTRFLFFLIPAVPTLFALYFQIKALMVQDELEKKLSAESWAIAAIIVGFVTFSYGFLEQAGLPKFPTFFYFPAVIMLWGIVRPILNRWY